jgi:hypothetical protein
LVELLVVKVVRLRTRSLDCWEVLLVARAVLLVAKGAETCLQVWQVSFLRKE